MRSIADAAASSPPAWIDFTAETAPCFNVDHLAAAPLLNADRLSAARFFCPSPPPALLQGMIFSVIPLPKSIAAIAVGEKIVVVAVGAG